MFLLFVLLCFPCRIVDRDSLCLWHSYFLFITALFHLVLQFAFRDRFEVRDAVMQEPKALVEAMDFVCAVLESNSSCVSHCVFCRAVNDAGFSEFKQNV